MGQPVSKSLKTSFSMKSNILTGVVLLGTLRLSESESRSASSSAYTNMSQSSKSSKSTIPLDVLSSDYADMTLGSSMRNTGPTLSPKENIKKLKSSFFACGTIDENRMDYTSSTHSNSQQTNQSSAVTTNSRNSNTTDAGEYTIMNPAMVRRIVAQQPPLNSASNVQTPFPMSAKKTAVVTSNNNPDKVLANTQSKNSIDGFKPISSNTDKEVYMQNAKSASTSNTAFNRQHSAPVEKQRKPSTDNGAYELLELRSSSSTHSVSIANRITRPNSVNSEKNTFTPLNRPNSANSERQSTSTYSLTSTPLDQSTATSVNFVLHFFF